MHWFYLAAAIILEVCGTTSMKLSNGFRRPLASVLVFVFYGASLSTLTLALRSIDMSVAYATWGSLGTVLIVAIGVIAFEERLTGVQVLSIALVLLGVVGLHLGGRRH